MVLHVLHQLGGEDAPVSASTRIVVGVSGTASGRAALQQAIHTAKDRDATLELVRVWRDVGRVFGMTRDEALLLSASQGQDRAVLSDAEDLVHMVAPELSCFSFFERGDVYHALLRRSAGADLLVLGGGDAHTGSAAIAAWFEKHSGVPVVTVHPPARRSPVVS